MGRWLEIGPGPERLDGFETLNIIRTPVTDHVGDARRPPFAPGSFELVYSSHCIEHIEWYEIEATIAAWARLLVVGGALEVHTVNAYALMRVMIEFEETGTTSARAGSWREPLHGGDPYTWASGRILNVMKKGEKRTHELHRAILTPRYMRRCFERAGLTSIEPVAEPRGLKKHRGINMGLRGIRC